MNFCTSAMYHMQRPQLCAGHGQRHRPIKVGMAMRQLKLRGGAGPSYRRPDTIHATWARARPAWPAPGRWLGQRTRSTGCRAASLGQPKATERVVVNGSYFRYEAKAATPHLRMRPARWKARHTYASRAQCSRLSSTEQEVDLGPGTTKPRSRTRRLLKARWAPQPGGDREE